MSQVTSRDIQSLFSFLTGSRYLIEACTLGEKSHARSYSQKAPLNEEGDDSASKVPFSSLMLDECSKGRVGVGAGEM